MILITGGSGTLGRCLQQSLQDCDVPYKAPTRDALNLSSNESIDNFFKNNVESYTHIIHLAAKTNVDQCELDPKDAYEVNVLATERLSRYAQILNATFVYMSTSAVFGQVRKFRYNEMDLPMPINAYGNSKLLGEHAVQRLCSKYLIVRIAWLLGASMNNEKKFIANIMEKLQKNETLSVVQDKIGSISCGFDVSKFIIKACKEGILGIRHIVSQGYCTRFDIAQTIALAIGSRSNIIPIESRKFPLPAPRSDSECLDSLHNNGIPTRLWQEVVKDYISRKI